VNYLGIPAIEMGLRHIERIGIDVISRRVNALGSWLLGELGRLRHANGRPAVRVYGPTTWRGRGATIALNFLHPDGRIVDERYVDIVAAEHNASVRTGCLCNPGAGEAAFSLGVATNFADVYRFMHMATAFLDLTEVPSDLSPWAAC
jgi:selenocysteine lyase/cysteine desulfurase